MEERRFDDLTRAIAQSTSRRRVLKGLLAAVAGGALSSLGLGALAKGNDDAAHFCATVFPPGPDRGQCTNDAAHGTGLYYQCQGNAANVCLDSNGVTCPDFSSDANHCGACGNMCPSGQPCLDGSCGCSTGQTMCDGSCVATCDSYLGQVLDPTTCQCKCPEGQLMLQSGFCLQSCTTDTDCPQNWVCDTTTEGDRVCGDGGYLPFCSPCETSLDCQTGCFAVNAYCSDIDHLCH